MKKRVFVVVAVVVAVVALSAGAVLASSFASVKSGTEAKTQVSLKGKTIFLQNSELGFIISDDKIPALVEELKEKGVGGCAFVLQVEKNMIVTDSATGVKFLTDDGTVSFQEGLDVYDIDNVTAQWLINGEIERGHNPMIGMYNTDFGELDYFEIAL